MCSANFKFGTPQDEFFARAKNLAKFRLFQKPPCKLAHAKPPRNRLHHTHLRGAMHVCAAQIPSLEPRRTSSSRAQKLLQNFDFCKNRPANLRTRSYREIDCAARILEAQCNRPANLRTQSYREIDCTARTPEAQCTYVQRKFQVWNSAERVLRARKNSGKFSTFSKTDLQTCTREATAKSIAPHVS